MSSHASLNAAAQERKARLAKLKNLKRKAPDAENENAEPHAAEEAATTSLEQDVPVNPYLSGRNFDPETRNAKLGFEHNPAADQDTAERRAQELAEQEREVRRKEEQEEAENGEAKPLDLFKLQPKKANWDLKRDMERRMEKLNVKTENAIARAVRERIATQQMVQEGASANDEQGDGIGGGEGQAAGLKGEELVSALHAKELQEAEEERREREEDEEEEEGFK